MTNPITTLSREELQKLIHLDGMGCVIYRSGQVAEIARALLAVMDAKPFGYAHTYNPFARMASLHKEETRHHSLKLYTTPPAPSVPDGWIKCSDRLPESDKVVLCGCFFEGPDDFRIKTGGNVGGVMRIVGGSWEVTHWMPLPAPPEE